MIERLRSAAASQEQYRLATGRYADRFNALGVELSGIDSASITAHDSAGWRGSLYVGRYSCSLWVRDTSLRKTATEEGSP